MQIRRLADLAFMFQLYELAYQMYHAAKKEFNSEHAWLHFAGALVSKVNMRYLMNACRTSTCVYAHTCTKWERVFFKLTVSSFLKNYSFILLITVIIMSKFAMELLIVS